MKNDVSIAGLIREEARAEVRKMLRGLLAALDHAPAFVDAEKPKRRPRKPRTAKTAVRVRDAETGVEWAGRGRKPANFDASRAKPVEQMAA